MPAYNVFGQGEKKILAMHSWFSDSTCYAPILPYINPEEYTLFFVDLRGYGTSLERKGNYTLEEAIQDVEHIIKTMQWSSFFLLTHSLSHIVGEALCHRYGKQVLGHMAIAPKPPLPNTPESLLYLQEAALQNDTHACECLHTLTHRKYSSYAIQKMVDSWRKCSTPEARMGYLELFHERKKPRKAPQAPSVFILGDPAHEEDPSSTFYRERPHAHLVFCKNAGHFPMQETPLQLANILDTFTKKALAQ